jgi:hypothetical protein
VAGATKLQALGGSEIAVVSSGASASEWDAIDVTGKTESFELASEYASEITSSPDGQIIAYALGGATYVVSAP